MRPVMAPTCTCKSTPSRARTPEKSTDISSAVRISASVMYQDSSDRLRPHRVARPCPPVDNPCQMSDLRRVGGERTPGTLGDHDRPDAEPDHRHVVPVPGQVAAE